MAEYNGGSAKADHLCVLVHGLWGQPEHLGSVAAALRDGYSEDQLHILVAGSNSGYYTYDGIDTGGERVCLEIEDALEAAAGKGAKITKLSVVGYSMGGLVARYAVGLLHAKGIMDKLECKNFAAFASPFLGVRSPTRGAFSTVFNAIGSRTISVSGRQLFGIDSFRDTGRPLLTILADPESIFMAGLRRFGRHTLYANIVNDHSAVYYTTALSKTDPFAEVAAAGGDIEDLPLHFVPGYDQTIMADKEPIALDRLAAAMKRVRERTASGGAAKAKAEAKTKQGIMPAGKAVRRFLAKPWNRERRLQLFEAAPMVAISLLLPLGLTLFLLNAVYQHVQSSKRLKRHEGGLAGIDSKSYRLLPLWMKGLRDTVEDAYEDINTAQDPEFASPDDSDSDLESIAQGVQQPQVPLFKDGKGSKITTTAPADGSLLALSPEQFTMIDNLDSLGWNKYRVWIRKIRHSHAAIIVRHESPRFEEGKTVLRHFVNEEFAI
ncbi:hypothetical protein SPBR_07152 [Sporothrix brasiliensis 5110]|uniref:DUF676 domain-containing protein n=1 Tax=Sporothrix brasiliensis 5110 TaxID=1398154 RepID=A0A0C2IFR8_9PEZI|nr:uncharacterized protein SPBR_07152 [Sporothrix brasiliensis 5110]KIH88056.1 hypothetical protein SPBR_07152 [Sporothrix brasiliensis 5110]